MRTLVLAAVALLAGVAPAQAGKDAERDFEIRTLPTRANTVSGQFSADAAGAGWRLAGH